MKKPVSIDPTVGSRSNFFHEFPEAVLDGVARNRYDTPMLSGRGHSTDIIEYRVKRPVSIDPIVGSRSNFFHEFPEVVFDGEAWNRYETSTVSVRRRYTNRTSVPGEKVRISRSDRWIALKFFSRVSGGCF